MLGYQSTGESRGTDTHDLVSGCNIDMLDVVLVPDAGFAASEGAISGYILLEILKGIEKGMETDSLIMLSSLSPLSLRKVAIMQPVRCFAGYQYNDLGPQGAGSRIPCPYCNEPIPDG